LVHAHTNKKKRPVALLVALLVELPVAS